MPAYYRKTVDQFLETSLSEVIGELTTENARFGFKEVEREQIEAWEEEIELLFLVTPEVVQALDPCEVPQCYPAMHTDDPNDCELYWKGFDEVPSHGPCVPGECRPIHDGLSEIF